MRDSLPALGVKPRDGQMEKKMTILDTPIVKVPDFVGLSKTELMDQMVNLKIDASGEGDTVVRQSPEPGAKVKEGATVRLFFDKKSN